MNKNEEKDFNRAMCTTCLLEWPMAQCLSCKFYTHEKEVEFNPNTMEAVMYNGWTPQLSKKTLDAVELATLAEMVKENPGNVYWQGRLEAKRQEMEIALDAEWLDGTELSPIISGGEILYRNYKGNDDIPF